MSIQSPPISGWIRRRGPSNFALFSTKNKGKDAAKVFFSGRRMKASFCNSRIALRLNLAFSFVFSGEPRKLAAVFYLFIFSA